jgi:hypothetical protein
MANSSPTPDPSYWRDLYTAEKEHWNDINRSGKVLIPIALLWFMATITAILHVAIHFTIWSQKVTTGFQSFFLFARVFVIIFIPLFLIILGVVLLFRVVVRYITDFHAQYKDAALRNHIRMKLLGVAPLPPPLDLFVKYPSVVIKDAASLSPDHWARWFGGPASLVIFDGFALYLERGNRFSRVVGPGGPPNPFLERFETIKAVVDLRPQFPPAHISPWTKDGIQVEIDVRVECQINANEYALRRSSNLVYPFDPLAVKEAVEFTTVRKSEETGQLIESEWLDATLGQVTGYISRHISRHSADEIALTELKDVGTSDGNLHTFELAREHLDEINRDLVGTHSGTHVNNIHIVLKFPLEVEEKRLEYWKSERKRLAIIRESIAEAAGIRIRQEARARAERDVLDAITERLKRVGPENLTEPLLLSLAGILDNNLDDPVIRPLIARNSLELLEKIKKILKEKF